MQNQEQRFHSLVLEKNKPMEFLEPSKYRIKVLTELLEVEITASNQHNKIQATHVCSVTCFNHVDTSIQNNKRIQSYEEMGFTREQAERAVKKYASDEQALEWLFSSASSEEHNSPQTPPKQINVNASENEQTIMSMGFSQEQAKNALEMANGNVETAISILLDNM